MKEKEIADRRNFLKGSMAGAAGLVVASTTSVALGAESGKKQKPALATDGNVTNKVDVLVVGGGTAGPRILSTSLRNVVSMIPVNTCRCWKAGRCQTQTYKPAS